MQDRVAQRSLAGNWAASHLRGMARCCPCRLLSQVRLFCPEGSPCRHQMSLRQSTGWPVHNRTAHSWSVSSSRLRRQHKLLANKRGLPSAFQMLKTYLARKTGCSGRSAWQQRSSAAVARQSRSFPFAAENIFNRMRSRCHNHQTTHLPTPACKRRC